MEKNEKKEPFYKKRWFWIAIIFLVIVISISNHYNDKIDTSSNVKSSHDTITLMNGNLESFTVNPDTTKHGCIIKAKIEASYSNKATIHQNFFNVEDFIKNQNGNSYDEIQYWAVADMKSGQESKVISFTLDKKVIEDLYNEKIAANQLDKYVEDFWVIDSLK